MKIPGNSKNDSGLNSVTISPLYPNTVYFSAQANICKQTFVIGEPEGFFNKTINLHELYFQRYAGKQGTFRVIHCKGTGLETVSDSKGEYSETRHIDEKFRFDELGIFEGEPADPVDLVPLYPGHPVAQGEHWKPEVAIKIPMGTGLAQYDFFIESINQDEKGSVLAKINFYFIGNLKPSGSFLGGEVTATGKGWLLWDCTVNQRKETHISATYHAQTAKHEVKQLISLDDKLWVHPGQKQF